MFFLLVHLLKGGELLGIETISFIYWVFSSLLPCPFKMKTVLILPKYLWLLIIFWEINLYIVSYIPPTPHFSHSRRQLAPNFTASQKSWGQVWSRSRASTIVVFFSKGLNPLVNGDSLVLIMKNMIPRYRQSRWSGERRWLPGPHSLPPAKIKRWVKNMDRMRKSSGV